MTVMDGTLGFLLKSFKLRNKELDQQTALAEAAKLPKFFAVELYYRGKPIRLIVAASDVPENLLEQKPRTDAEKVLAATNAQG